VPLSSKWNNIEHRLFSYISQSWRGRPLLSHEVIVNLIANTKTKQGLKVRANLDRANWRRPEWRRTAFGPLVAQTLGGVLAPMGGTVVHHPKDTASGFVRFLAHDFGDMPGHRRDAAV
jgi:hypothetical protein